jgi:hypothetical protein
VKYLSPKDILLILKETHGASVGARGGVFLGFCVNKGYDDGMSFNKELQNFNIPYSLFKQLRKNSIYVIM